MDKGILGLNILKDIFKEWKIILRVFTSIDRLCLKNVMKEKQMKNKSFIA